MIDPAPSYRRGLASQLEASGFRCPEFGSAAETATASFKEANCALYTVRSTGDWHTLAELKDHFSLLVALLVDPTAERCAECFRLGANAVAPWDATLERILDVVVHALQGESVIPVEVIRAMAFGGAPLLDKEWVQEEEVEWLRILANGFTVTDMAAKVGYSERALYRLLHGLYGRMGVSNRTEAILQAQRWGLL